MHLGLLIVSLFYRLDIEQYVWGGSIQDKGQFIFFELMAIFVLCVFGFFILVKSKYLHFPSLRRTTSIILYISVAYFFINTIGNIFAPSYFEKSFALISFLLCLFTLRIAIE